MTQERSLSTSGEGKSCPLVVLNQRAWKQEGQGSHYAAATPQLKCSLGIRSSIPALVLATLGERPASSSGSGRARLCPAGLSGMLGVRNRVRDGGSANSEALPNWTGQS